MNGMSPRQSPVYILRSLENKYPCILVLPILLLVAIDIVTIMYLSIRHWSRRFHSLACVAKKAAANLRAAAPSENAFRSPQILADSSSCENNTNNCHLLIIIAYLPTPLICKISKACQFYVAVQCRQCQMPFSVKCH